MDIKLKQALHDRGAHLVVLSNWTKQLLAKEAQISKQEQAVQALKQPLQKHAMKSVQDNKAEFSAEYEQWKTQAINHDILTKEASPGTTAVSAGQLALDAGKTIGQATYTLFDKLGPIALIGVPAMLGASSAYVWRKMAQPSAQELNNLQKAVYADTLQGKISEINRAMAIKKLEKSKKEEISQPRSIRL